MAIEEKVWSESPIKAIGYRCLDCGGGSSTERKNCPVEDCILYNLRMGRRPSDLDDKTPTLKVIKKYCLWCMCDQPNEVKLCPSKDCPLYPFREGKNPFASKKEYSEEELEKKRESMKKAREAKKSNNTSI